jgi:hypothetical protein
MVRAIKIENSWDMEEVRELAEKFNRYCYKNSLSTISETLEKLQNLMEKRSGKLRKQAAEVLSLIADENPLLIDELTQKKAAYISAGWEDLVQELEIEDKSNKKNDIDLSANNTKKQKENNDYSNIFVEPLNKQSKIEQKVIKTAEDWLKSSEANTYRPKYTPMFKKEFKPSLPDPEEILKETGMSVKIGEDQSGKSQEQEYETWNPEDFGSEGNENGTEDSEQTEFLNLDISQMNLKNIAEVKWDPEFNTRKCALGDGEFKDYSGKIYQCTCGTLYHEICLKTQASFVGKCQICEREFKSLPK